MVGSAFQELNRSLSLVTEKTGSDFFGAAYFYDAVGSMRRMEQTRSDSLSGKVPEAVYTWSYDDRYRLTNETVVTNDVAMYSTYYSWDHADNRLSRTNYVAGVLDSVTTYTNNALNQMTGWPPPGYGVWGPDWSDRSGRTKKTAPF